MQRGHILRIPDNLQSYFINLTHETTPKKDENLTYSKLCYPGITF